MAEVSILEAKLYIDDIKYVAELPLEWDKLIGANVLITGARGLIGSFFIDVLMYKNDNDNLDCNIFAVGRNSDAARNRFGKYWVNPHFNFIECDINNFDSSSLKNQYDYILHLASNTHPVYYATKPIETINTNIIALNKLLDFATKCRCKRFVYASSNEIYGENRGDTEFFDEDYCGYINCNTLRAGYPESKRCGEALCQAYIEEKGLDVVIPRFTRSFGPTVLAEDSKAINQFIKKAIDDEDIILKSEGEQFFSYIYVADAVAGLLYVFLRGKIGEAYNIAYEKADIKLKELAAIIAQYCGRKVIFQLPDKVESKGYSKATKARLDSNKIIRLGWIPQNDIEFGVSKTIKILKGEI